MKFRGYPEPTLYWYDVFNNVIIETCNRYEVKIIDNYMILKVYFLPEYDSFFESDDYFLYTLKANNSLYSIEKQFGLVVKGLLIVNLI